MNAAARLVHQSLLSRHFVWNYVFGYPRIVALIATVLLSALSIIYVTHEARLLHAAYAHSLVEQDRLHAQTNQLLLERSTWMMQARIQKIAEQQLGMVVPAQKSIIMVHE